MSDIDDAVNFYKVQRLLAAYCQALDDQDVNAVVGMFIAEGTFDAAVGGVSVGREAIRAYFANQLDDPSWAELRGGQHLVANVRITASAESLVSAMSDFIYVIPGSPDGRIVFAGRYEDVIETRGEAWLFASRTTVRR